MNGVEIFFFKGVLYIRSVTAGAFILSFYPSLCVRVCECVSVCVNESQNEAFPCQASWHSRSCVCARVIL